MLGSFAPLVHLVLVLYALAGFVVVPGGRGHGGRRVAALFVLVLMPLALLLPWPAVMIQHPGTLLHGVGGWVDGQAVSVLHLVGLSPGGPGAWPLVGLVVVFAALAGLVMRPHRSMLPGLALMLLGVLAVGLVLMFPVVPVTGGPAERGFTGAPLLVVGWGLLWGLLGACRPTPAGQRASCATIAATLGVVSLAVLATAALLAGQSGPLRGDGTRLLASTLVNELRETGQSVLIMNDVNGPVRQVAGRLPRFGDDDFTPVPSAVARLTALRDGLMAAEPERERAAVGDLVSAAPPTSDNRPVLRVQLATGQVTLLSPELAGQALTGGAPPDALGTRGIVLIDAAPPAVRVRTSDGPDGRLLVVAAEEEPGWQATVDGRQVPVVRAWAHLVGVQVPTRAAEIRVEQPTTLRAILLLTQAAVVLFTVLTAVPGRPSRP